MKHKIVAIFSAILMALTIGTLGIATAVPAQADWGTTVTYAGPEDSWVRVRNMNGVDKILHWDGEGETANNAAKIMPPSTNWGLRVCGTYSCRDLGPGESYVFPHDGHFLAWVGRVN